MEAANIPCEIPKSVSFFQNFGYFSGELEDDICNIKKLLAKPPGSQPKQYYNGMNSLKSEVDHLRKTGDELGEKMYQVRQFSHTLTLLRDLIKQQEEEVDVMEKYLERFGYKTPEECEPDRKNIPSDENSQSLERKENGDCSTAHHLSPQLNEMGKQTAEKSPQGQPQHKQTSKLSPKLNVRGNDSSTMTPAQKRSETASHATPTSHFSSSAPTPSASAMKRVEHWLNTLNAETCSSLLVTPDVCRGQMKSRTLGYEDEQTRPELKPVVKVREELYSYSGAPSLSNKLFGSGDDDSCTRTSNSLEEPTLETSFANRVGGRSNEREYSPDEPQLSSSTRNVQNKDSSVKKSTPDEPQLSNLARSVVESEDCRTRETPDEPQLSNFSKSVVETKNSCDEGHTPDEPLLASQQTYRPVPRRQRSDPAETCEGERARNEDYEERKNRSSPLKGSSRVYRFEPANFLPPISPQLSDITKKVLNEKFRSSEFNFSSKDDFHRPQETPVRVPLFPSTPYSEPRTPELSDVTMKVLSRK